MASKILEAKFCVVGLEGPVLGIGFECPGLGLGLECSGLAKSQPTNNVII